MATPAQTQRDPKFLNVQRAHARSTQRAHGERRRRSATRTHESSLRVGLVMGLMGLIGLMMGCTHTTAGGQRWSGALPPSPQGPSPQGPNLRGPIPRSTPPHSPDAQASPEVAAAVSRLKSSYGGSCKLRGTSSTTRAAASELAQLLRDTALPIDARTARALIACDIRDPRLVPALTPLLRSASRQTKLNTLQWLGTYVTQYYWRGRGERDPSRMLFDPASLRRAVLQVTVNTADTSLQLAALNTLKHVGVGACPAGSPLRPLWFSSDPKVRSRARSLAMLSPQCRPAVSQVVWSERDAPLRYEIEKMGPRHFVRADRRNPDGDRQNVKRALIGHLRRKLSPKARIHLTLQLAKMGERRTEESLVSWLRLYQGQLAATGRNATVEVFPEGVQRYWAEAVDVMRVLGAMKSRRAAPVLRALMRQSYNKHGSDAMKALGKIGDQEAIPLIMARFDHEHANPFDYADGAAALRSINAAEAVRLLSNRLTVSSARTRHRAAWVLRELKDKRSAPALLSRVDDKDPTTRGRVREALGQVVDAATSLAILRKSLKDPSKEVRLLTINGLGDFANPAKIALLESALSDEHLDPRVSACEALGRTKGGEATMALVRAAYAADASVRARCGVALRARVELVPAQRALVRGLLSSERAVVRQVAVRALTPSLRANEVSIITGLLQDRDSAVREVAREALIHRGTLRSLAALASR